MCTVSKRLLHGGAETAIPSRCIYIHSHLHPTISSLSLSCIKSTIRVFRQLIFMLINVGVATLWCVLVRLRFAMYTIACILREEHNHSLLFICLLPPFHIVEYNISYIYTCFLFALTSYTLPSLEYSGLCCMPKKRRGGRLVLGG
jgi:hypothetical protein